MKITQVTPGLIQIPPNGWGAIEKIIWEYSNSIKKIGHQCDIKYLNDVEVSDIVHIHVANLAIEASKKGIPYIFSLHDHHVVHYGKNSALYQENLKAIKGSIISFTHAEFLVDYFDETDKLFYLSHGVNTEIYKSNKKSKTEHKLLCVANNGLGGDQTYDRKGFGLAIEAAKRLNLPITIAGPDNNRNFFEHHQHLLDYENLNLIFTNPDEKSLIELYNDHTIFLHPSMLEAGHPNLTLLESVSCNVPVVGTYLGSQKIEGMVVVERDVEKIVNGIKSVMDNYEYFVEKTNVDREKFDWDSVVGKLVKIYDTLISIRKDIDTDTFSGMLSESLEKTDILKIKPNLSVTFSNHYVNGAFCEVRGNTGSEYLVEFINSEGKTEYSAALSCNMWARSNKKYFDDCTIRVTENGDVVFSEKYNAGGKRVYISIDSKSIGDTLAWVPFVEEFRIKHKCSVICSTFWNHLFIEGYPQIEFVEPGKVVNNIYAMYNIGWFYDSNREPFKPGTVPLQKTASDILGLDFIETRPRLTFDRERSPLESKYVTIGTASTAGCKEWDLENWQTVVDELNRMGYLVAVVQKEQTSLENVIDWTGNFDLAERMNQIYHSDFYIGLGSGISWLAWAVEKHVFMIANFSEDGHEFTQNTTRITNKSVCNSCWNNPNFKFDKGDWYWCPVNKGTPRQFECQKSITPSMVLQKIKEYTNG